MKNTFELNGKTYVAKAFTYNMICDLDDMGIGITDASTRPNSFIRGYIAVCGDITKAEAGAEIEAHLINGGTLDAVANAMTKEMENSDFFRALSNKKSEAPKASTRKTAESK